MYWILRVVRFTGRLAWWFVWLIMFCLMAFVFLFTMPYDYAAQKNYTSRIEEWFREFTISHWDPMS